MKMARATKDDIQRCIKFFHFIEEYLEFGTHTPENAVEEEISLDLTEEDFVAKLREHWGGPFTHRPGVDCCWRRVVHGCDILIDNICDPDADALDWKPELKAALAEPDGLDAVLDGLCGNPDTFRPILLDKTALLADFCDHVALIAKRERRPAWSVISDITKHGSGVSAAIYELYRRKPEPAPLPPAA